MLKFKQSKKTSNLINVPAIPPPMHLTSGEEKITVDLLFANLIVPELIVLQVHVVINLSSLY